MKIFLKQHILGIFLSFCIGAIIAAPPFIFRFSKDYQGFHMMKTNTEAHYVAQVQEVYDGHYGLGNPFFADLKDTPYAFPPLSPYLVAGFGRLFGLSTIEAVMVFRFFATSALAFFIYLFTAEITKQKLAGLVAAPFVMLAYSLVDPSYILSIFRDGGLPPRLGFIDYGRPTNPQVSSLLFFSYLYFFWKSLEENTARWKTYGAMSTVLLGLSFYAYLFTWTFLLSLNGFLFLVYAWRKEWGIVKRIFFISLGAFIIGIPYLLHTLEVARHPDYTETVTRFGFVNIHTPNISRVVIGALLLFLLTFRRFETHARRFFFAFFLTAFFVVNEQVLTGIYVFNHHYHWYYNTPLVIVFAVATLFAFVHGKRATWIASALCILFFFHGIWAQKTAYEAVLPTVIAEQRYAPLIEWINKESSKDATMFASHELADPISSLTHANVYYNGTAIYTLAPNERFFHAYLMFRYLDNVPTTTARAYFETHRNDISGFVFGYAYSFLPDTCFGCFPDTVIDRLTAAYTQLSDEIFITELKKYPVDYIIWDKQRYPSWRIDRFGLPLAIQFGDIGVYTVGS